ncbi:uncharacterized protein GGS22DRAFT_194788 [Annulohypoxylon maeteangense]|uniref:uncharacterized protein n=1 Tax=Annulohypoxylon maeteangense TaxID=1927788 RepID=UPI0020083254|nr:uncharacterized protein GGS22DRAFT_194788 [Annulohypoxylon maeteangense]KAI0884212.1 hypothetical protein GGS22DRAFT_194788 [Annulohypoxylon maeteangense]
MDDYIQDGQPAGTAELSSPLTWTPEHNAYTLSAAAVENDSIPELKKSLALARIFLPKFDTDYVQFRDEVFRDVLGHHSITLLTYMLDHEGVPVSLVTPNSIFQWASLPLIEALIARGWDVNAQDGAAFNGKRLIDYLVRERYGKEDLVRWLIEGKGAAVESQPCDTDGYKTRVQLPPLLETCAAFGSVSMFKFLEEKGARSSWRILHVAVETAASRGANPDCEVPAQTPNEKAKNMSVEMLHYLVDERQLDINGMDADGTPQNPTDSHWDTPICYASRCRNGAPVVRWLLKKGADPTSKNPNSGFDAVAYAKEAKCDEVLSVLEEWQRTKVQR